MRYDEAQAWSMASAATSASASLAKPNHASYHPPAHYGSTKIASQQWSGTGPEIAKRRLREGIQVLAGLGRALLASAEIVTNIIGAD